LIPGYIHFPAKDGHQVTDEYLEQLTGEKKIIVRDKRTRTKKAIYVKTYNRNEALDLTVYCYAALFCLQNVIDPTTSLIPDSLTRRSSAQSKA